jgi:hypothetical protein
MIHKLLQSIIGVTLVLFFWVGCDTPVTTPEPQGIKDIWDFYEKGITADCVGTAPGSAGNGAYVSRFTLRVSQNGNTITGSGNCTDNNPINLGGTVNGTTVQFQRYGTGCTPGFTVVWDYSGVIQGDIIAGTFSGGGDPKDPYAKGCKTSGTFTINMKDDPLH